MRDSGGFEANAQNLRVLQKIEVKLPGIDGLDLTRATLDAILKYKVPFDGIVKKFYYTADTELVKWISQGHTDQSLECMVMELADDTAYAAHDLEDGVHAGMITLQRAGQKKKEVLANAKKHRPTVRAQHWEWAIAKISQMTQGSRTSTEREKKAQRKESASSIIGEVVRGARKVKRASGELSPRYQYRLAPSKNIEEQLEVLKQLNYALLIDDARVQTLEARAEKILKDLHRFFGRESAARAYPEDLRLEFQSAKNDKERARVACDFIAGMTDQYAERMHQRLFTASRSALFDY